MTYPIAILAGGLGTRLRAVAPNTPKALVPVAGRPFIDHQLELLRSRGMTRAVVCTGHLGTMIEEHVGDGRRFGMSVAYSHDGASPLGTAGALRRALPLLGSAFFTIYGDSYLDCDFAAVQAAFDASERTALMTVCRNPGTLVPSNVLFEGRIVRYDKAHPTPQMEHVDYGLGVFRAGAFDGVPLDRPTDLAVVFERLLEQDQLAAYEVHDRFYEVGTPASLAELEDRLGGEKP